MPSLPHPLRTLAAKRVARYTDAARRAQLVPWCIEEGPGEAERVWACSEFVADTCTRDPSLLAGLRDRGDLGPRRAPRDDDALQPGRVSHYLAHLRETLGENPGEAALRQGLRRMRRREMVRIAWRDIGGLAGLEEVMGEISAFADAVLVYTCDVLHRRLAATLGEPTSREGRKQRLVVYALGKLGAKELNFSSDIDLIFAYPEEGECRNGKKTLANQEFFARLGQKLVQTLSERNEEGIVFRVDMRLRPFGNAGPLVSSFGALEDYYQNHGRDWERYALIRARPITGDGSDGADFLERLRPFVYRRYLDFGALQSMREMKRLISDEVTRRGLEDDVKLGAGGIRELEFTGQAFQMVRGGRVPALRDRHILRVIAELGRLGLLPEYAVAELARAYRFLRTAEHRIQQMQDRQSHTLPGDEPGRSCLAAGMGFDDWPAFAAELERQRARVHAHFAQVLGPTTTGTPLEDPLVEVWAGSLDPAPAGALLDAAGYEDGREAYLALRRFADTHAVRFLDTRGRERLARLMPDLLRACASSRPAGDTLSRTLKVIETVTRRSVYIALLCERPIALSQLVRLCRASPWIARQIARHPLLLDELLDPRTLYAPLDRAALIEDLALRLADVAPEDTEQEMTVLRQFKHASTLRVAAADVARTMPLMVVSDHLTDIAEITLAKAAEIAMRDLVARHGEARCRVEGEEQSAPFAIVAYGKLGGFELGYGSDLDLVFLHGSRGETQQTQGPRVIDNARFFARVAQRIIHFISMRTTDGVLYEIDARLRPDGGKGILVNSLSGLAAYLRESAWTWEQQALVRARVVAGDRRVRERFMALRREILLRPREPARLRSEVREMRERMRTHLSRDTTTQFDLKQGEGGIADIEFVVQYLVLRWASRLGDYLDYTDNIRLLDGCDKTGVMAPRDVRSLTDAYRAYRARMHENALHESAGVVAQDEFAEHRKAVSRLWGDLMEA